jgi:hypothetical protein
MSGVASAQTPTPSPAPTPSPTPCVNYAYTVSAGAIVPGTIGPENQCDECSSSVTLPFSYQLYDTSFNRVMVGSNGHLTFATINDAFDATCIPQAVTTYAIFPYRTDLCTVSDGLCGNNVGTGYGVFISTTGSPPNRIFNIEWRAAYFNSSDQTANFEVRLYEGQTAFDIVYGTITPKSTANDGPLSVGVQKNTSFYTLEGCDPTGGTNPPVSSGQVYHYTLGNGCPIATPSPSPTPTATATVGAGTPTPTATATPTGNALPISGTVSQCDTTGPSGILLPHVTMTLTIGPGGGSTFTDGNGNYRLFGFQFYYYTLTPSRAARLPGTAGIDTTDVIAVQRHFLAISLLTGCRLSAADTAPPFGSIDTADVIAIQRFFLGLSIGIGRTGQYAFDPPNRTYTIFFGGVGQNFDTVVYGDVGPPFAFP